jgi:hypothetical protein
MQGSVAEGCILQGKCLDDVEECKAHGWKQGGYSNAVLFAAPPECGLVDAEDISGLLQ